MLGVLWLAAGCGPCLDLPESWRVTSELRLPLPRGWPEVAGESSLFVLDTPEILSLRAPDILVDRGVLYHRRALERDGKFRLALNRRPSIETRDIAVSIPALDLVRNSMYRPEDVLMHLVRRSLCDGAGETRSDSRPPFLVHGKTFLELREFIGLALFRYYPEYREWAQGNDHRDAERGS